MHRIIASIFIFLFVTASSSAQETAGTLVMAEFSPLVATIPADWIHQPARGAVQFHFQTSDFTMTVYHTYQHVLVSEKINPNDLDAALKLYPFQPDFRGRRSLIPAGWAHPTTWINHHDTAILINDYTYTDTPALEMLRLLDTGMIVLAQINFEAPNPTHFDAIYDVFASIRMTEPDEFTCTLADFGDAPVYTTADVTSAIIEDVPPTTPILNYFFTPDASWFTLQAGGFVRFNDRDPDLFSASDCYRAPFTGERIPPIDPETIELTEILRFEQGYFIRFPAAGEWHKVSDINVIQDNILNISFNIFGVGMLDRWQAEVAAAATPESNCRVEKTYENITVGDVPLVRYTTVDSCADSLPYRIYLAVQLEANVLLVADVTPVFQHRPLTDITIAERIVASVAKSAIGDILCTGVTTQNATAYADRTTDSAIIETLPENTEIKIQTFGRDAQDNWWIQLVSGHWIRLETADYPAECAYLPVMGTD